MGPSEEEKRAAKMQAIAQFGLGLLGTRKGDEWNRVGQSGAYALQSQGDALHNASAQKMQSMAAAQQAMGLQENLQKFKDADAARQAAMEYAKQKGTAPAMPNMAPTNANAATLAQQQSAPPDLYKQLMAKADFYESKGLAQQADAIREAAQKYAPKYKGIESVTGPDGKPTLLQTFDNQAPSPMQGYAPKPDFKQVDTGGGVGFVDPWTRQEGPAFAKTNSPDAMLSSDTARRGQNMTDARSRDALGQSERHFQANLAKDKDGKPLTAEQGQASMYLGMMKSASKDIDKLGNAPAPSEVALARGDVPLLPKFAQNMLASDKAQKYAQSSLQWTEAMLRITTGATAPPEEVARTAKTFFPQVNDGEAVKAQKNERRKQMEEFVRIKAGGGAAQVDKTMSSGWSITPVK
jgi:hypothetical protein